MRTRRGRGPGSMPLQSMRAGFHFHERRIPGTNFRPAVLAVRSSLLDFQPASVGGELLLPEGSFDADALRDQVEARDGSVQAAIAEQGAAARIHPEAGSGRFAGSHILEEMLVPGSSQGFVPRRSRGSIVDLFTCSKERPSESADASRKVHLLAVLSCRHGDGLGRVLVLKRSNTSGGYCCEFVGTHAPTDPRVRRRS